MYHPQLDAFCIRYNGRERWLSASQIRVGDAVLGMKVLRAHEEILRVIVNAYEDYARRNFSPEVYRWYIDDVYGRHK